MYTTEEMNVMYEQHKRYCSERQHLCPVCRDEGKEFYSLMEQGFTAGASERILKAEDQI
jgi:hypothetical protein